MTTPPAIVECEHERDELLTRIALLDVRLAEAARDARADADEAGRIRAELTTRTQRLHAVEAELDRLVGDLWAG